MILRLLLALITVAAGHAIDLTGIADFSTNEDTVLVVSYATLNGKCAISEGPADRYKIEAVAVAGTISLAAYATGPWTVASNGSYFLPGSYLRYVPSTNVYGTRSMLSLRACMETNESFPATANIVIIPQPDPPVAANGTYASVTEDTPFTFTYAQLTSTLGINDPDGEAYDIKIVSLLKGTMNHSVGYRIQVGGNVTWTPPLNVYTKPANSNYAEEPDYAAFTVQAISPTAPATSAVVTLKTRITGVVDTPSGGVSTLTSFDPIRMAPGTMTEYTYEQLRALAHGSNDVDRTGGLNFFLSNSVLNGIQIDRVISTGGVFSHVLNVSNTNMALINISEGELLRFIVPTSMIRGSVIAGIVEVQISSLETQRVPLVFDVNPITSGNTSSTGDSAGGGLGCGAGAAGLLIPILLLGFRKRAGSHHA